MATNFLMSPGVILLEQDQSSYAVTTSVTKVSMVGYASKGPVDTPTLCTSAQDFIDKFGKPSEDNPYMTLAALKYFEEGNTLLVTRVGYTDRDLKDLPAFGGVDDEEDTGWTGRLIAAFKKTDQAAQTAAVPTITGTRAYASGLTYITDVDFTLKYYNSNLGTSYEADITGSIGGPSVTSAALLATALNTLIPSGAGDYFEFGTSGNYLTITMKDEDEYKDDLAALSISGTGGDTTISQLGFLENNRSARGVGYGDGTAAGESSVTVTAKTYGAWGNDITVRFYSETSSQFNAVLGEFITETIYKATIYYEDKAVEQYDKIEWIDATSDYYVETLFIDTYGSGSDYVSIENTGTDNYPPVDIADDPNDFIALAAGANGIPVVDQSDGLSSTEASLLNSAVYTEILRGINTLANSETNEFDAILVPGQSSSVVINSALTLVGSRRDCIAVIDPPFGLNHEDVTVWHNGEGHGNAAAFNTSYAALYWPWLYDYDPYNKQYVWLPPSGYVAKQYVYTDSVSDPWQAPAGMTRGRVTALDVEQSASQSQRDLLYGGMNAVNPIVNFVGEGLTIWGQKTLLRDTKATNRVNVRRLLIYAERLVAKMAKSFVFEPNDETAWADFTRKANAILEPIRIRRGLYSYTVVMDSNTNTSETIDQNRMIGYIFLQPVKTAEFIEVYFTITSTGETFITE